MSLELHRDDPLAFMDGGEVVMENPAHSWCRDVVANALSDHFRGREEVYVANNLAIQYDERDATKVISADVFVALEPPPGGRPPVTRSWQTWVHGVPSVVLEITSRSTVANDQGRKLRIYESMGVQEYVLFDPWADDFEQCSMPEPMLVYARRGDRFERVERPDGWSSPALGLRLCEQGRLLRLVDPGTGRMLPTSEESARAAEEARAAAEAARRDAAEARRETAEARRETEDARRKLAEVEAELARLRGETGSDA